MFACIAHVPASAAAGIGTVGRAGAGAGAGAEPDVPVATDAAAAAGDASATAVTAALAELASEFSPRFEIVREDFVVVDVSGLERLLGTPREIGEAFARMACARGLCVGIALAATQTAAMVLALAQAGAGGVGGGVGGVGGEDGPIIVPLGQEAAALAPLSLEWLAVLPVAGSAADAAYLRRASPPTSASRRRASAKAASASAWAASAKAASAAASAPAPATSATAKAASTKAAGKPATSRKRSSKHSRLAGWNYRLAPPPLSAETPAIVSRTVASTADAVKAAEQMRPPELTVSGAVPGVLSMLTTRERDAIDARATLLDILDRWGLRTFGDFARLPVVDIFERLGDAGVRLQQIARGQDARPLVHTPVEEPFEATFTLEWPIDTLEPLSFVVTRLLEPLCARLERADRAAAVLDTTLRLVNRERYTRRLELPAAMRDAKVLRTLVLLDLESHPPAAGIDGVTIAIQPTPGRIVQHSLLTRAVPPPEQLSTLIARLTAVMGEGRVGAPALVDTHRPEAFDMHRFAPSEQLSAAPAPPLLLEQSPLALPAAKLTLRRFRQPVLAQVTVEEGRPVHVMPQGLPGGRITQAAGPWRTSGDWWSGRWDRDEWDVSLQNGHVYHLHHERAQAHWFVAGCYD
jgi:protein ImuB